jgi:transcriptional regulator with XRE-family HTH domain
MVTSTMARAKQASDIGPRLKGILRQRGWSLSRLSRETDGEVSTSQLSLLTRGEIAYPRVKTVQRICGALKLPPTALMSPAAQVGGGLSVADEGLPTAEGVVVVPFVRLDMSDEPIGTGHTTFVSASLLDGRTRLRAAVIDGGGLGPYVLTGDTVIFDPDQTPGHGSPVVVSHGGATLAAVHLELDGSSAYRLADGSWLDPLAVRLGGVIVKIERAAPSTQALLLLTRG